MFKQLFHTNDAYYADYDPPNMKQIIGREKPGGNEYDHDVCWLTQQMSYLYTNITLDEIYL